MCSFSDEFAADLSSSLNGITAGATSSGDVLCHKCGQHRALVQLRINDIYCRACFVAAFTHQVRATIGKWRRAAAQTSDSSPPPVMLFSDSLASLSLLYVFSAAQQQQQRKRHARWPCSGGGLDVLCSSRPAHQLLCRVLQFSNEAASAVSRVLRCTSISPACVATVTTSSSVPYDEAEVWLESGIESLLAATAPQLSRPVMAPVRARLLETMRLHVAVACCRQLRATHLLLPDHTGSHLAASLLAGMTDGRTGGQLQQLTAGAVQLWRHVRVMRPLSGVSDKQVALLVHHVGWMSAVKPVSQSADIQSSLTDTHRLTAQFVRALQTQFASTESTILRTAAKMTDAATTEHSTAVRRRCHLCRLPRDEIDSGVDDVASAGRAVQVSRWASTQRWTEDGATDGQFSTVAAEVESGESEGRSGKWRLCYACNSLATQVGESVMQRFMTVLSQLAINDEDDELT